MATASGNTPVPARFFDRARAIDKPSAHTSVGGGGARGEPGGTVKLNRSRPVDLNRQTGYRLGGPGKKAFVRIT